MELHLMAPGEEETLSTMIARTLLTVNDPDYPLEELETLAAYYNPRRLAEIAAKGPLYILKKADENPPLACGPLRPPVGEAPSP